jgi:hypothetical protein
MSFCFSEVFPFSVLYLNGIIKSVFTDCFKGIILFYIITKIFLLWEVGERHELSILISANVLLMAGELEPGSEGNTLVQILLPGA